MNNRHLFVALLILLSLVLSVPRIVYGQEEERTVIRISIQLDGSAKWTISQEMDLASEEDRAIFENYSKEIMEEKESLISEFSTTIQNIVSRASSLTGRPMTAREFNLTSSVIGITTQVGLIEYSFIWTSFARVEGMRVIVGDVFEGGFYLYDNDVLIVSYPQYLNLKETRPPCDSNRTNEVVWRGRRNFGQGEPYLLFEDRRTSIRIYLSKQILYVGESLDISGEVDPPLDGVPVTVRLIGPSSTKNIPLTTLADGSFHYSVMVEEPGDWTVFAYFQGWDIYLGSESERVNINVKQIVTMQPYIILAAAASLFSVLFILLLFSFRRKRKGNDEGLLLRTDFDLVSDILRDAGGVMPQSKLREITRFSGAKLSRILKEMEQRGEVRRTKKGREQIVFLIERH
ncbi:MAG: hypothetical protein QW201_01460 [Thermoproteota archaeon]